jgi:pteridine reductase
LQDNTGSLSGKVALITGAAHRIGAGIARMLHNHGMNVVLHYRNSRTDAETLQTDLLAQRENSVLMVKGDLQSIHDLGNIIKKAATEWGQLDLLVNNASVFFPTPVPETTEAQWDELFAANLKAPFFLSQAAAPFLQRSHGSIINIVDIHAERPLKQYPVYSMTKAGLTMLTKALACELAPQIRVNAIAPGAILWPEHDIDDETKERIIARTFLKRQGDPSDIARAVLYLARDANYVSGQVLTVDGGRSLNS